MMVIAVHLPHGRNRNDIHFLFAAEIQANHISFQLVRGIKVGKPPVAIQQLEAVRIFSGTGKCLFR